MSKEQNTIKDGIPDFRIDYNGNWYHDEAQIKRSALAKLFSDKALVVDKDGQYWLKTPFERYPVTVEDVPYVIVDFKKQSYGYDFMTNMAEVVSLGPEHPLELRSCKKTGQILPYVQIRQGLYARLGRSVYYNLAQLCGPCIESRGETYALGEMDGEC